MKWSECCARSATPWANRRARLRWRCGALGEIDLALAKAALGAEMDAPLPAASTSDPTNTSTLDWIVEAPAELRLQSARHPLLSGEVVPISLALGDEQRGLLITGPNTGGKTVAIKTAGLLALMALAGLPIPAEPGTQIPVYADVFADIGDEQSIEQSLSTFSSHMTNVIRILEQAGAQSLVLMDELGAGTDPTEGAALGRAILLQLMRLDATVIATTHHGELKLFAHATPGLRNASVEFNAETLSPTYHLAIGLPGRSNAIAIAERLGMPGAVLSDARASVAPDEAQMETLLAEIQAERSAAGDVRRAEEFAREEAESIREQLQRRREAFESGAGNDPGSHAAGDGARADPAAQGHARRRKRSGPATPREHWRGAAAAGRRRGAVGGRAAGTPTDAPGAANRTQAGPGIDQTRRRVVH